MSAVIGDMHTALSPHIAKAQQSDLVRKTPAPR